MINFFPLHKFIFIFLLWFFTKLFFFLRAGKMEIETINKSQKMISMRDCDAGIVSKENFDAFWWFGWERKSQKRSIFITGCHVFFAPVSHKNRRSKDEMIFCCFKSSRKGKKEIFSCLERLKVTFFPSRVWKTMKWKWILCRRIR